jgi:AAA+ superfamily predicted ATPase
MLRVNSSDKVATGTLYNRKHSEYSPPETRQNEKAADLSNVVSFTHYKANFIPFLGRFNSAEFRTLNNTSFKLNDYNGNTQVKETFKILRDRIVDPSTHFNYVLPQAILLSGPEGNGKTYVVKALAGELSQYKVPVISVSGGDFDINETGESTRNLEYLFDQAINKAAQNDKKTAIIYINNIETLAPRESNQINDESIKAKKLLAKFKNLLDTAILNNDLIDEDGNPVKIVIIGEISREDLMDQEVFSSFMKLAVTKPGNAEERLNVLSSIADKYKTLFGPTVEGNSEARSMILKTLAERTGGYSSRQLEQILVDAHNRAQNAHPSRNFVLPDDVLSAYNIYAFGSIQKNNNPEWFFRTSVAHELGHAVVRHLMKSIAMEDDKLYALPKAIDLIDLNPRSKGSSASLILKDAGNPAKSFEYMFAELASNYASIPAEYFVCNGLISAGPAGDLNGSTKILDDAIGLFGMGEKTGPIQPGNSFYNKDGYMKEEVKADQKTLSSYPYKAAFQIISFYAPYIQQMTDKYTQKFNEDSTKLQPINITGEEFESTVNEWVQADESRQAQFQALKDIVRGSMLKAKAHLTDIKIQNLDTQKEVSAGELLKEISDNRKPD